MRSCEDFRSIFSDLLEEEVDTAVRELFEQHLRECRACKSLWDEFLGLFGGEFLLQTLDPPDGLLDGLTASPCSRWLRMLFAAIDRELPEEQLGDLFEHLEACPDCRRVWGDFSLIHQAGEALQPSSGLVEICRCHEAPSRIRPVLGRKTATAAAYFLAVLASVVIGNPVTFARYSQASTTVQQLRSVVVPEVSEVARTGRGEFRVILWRALRFGEEGMQRIEKGWKSISGKGSEPDPKQR
jgi:predicted anti-sigma-YlaC factor YlaD